MQKKNNNLLNTRGFTGCDWDMCKNYTGGVKRFEVVRCDINMKIPSFDLKEMQQNMSEEEGEPILIKLIFLVEKLS